MGGRGRGKKRERYYSLKVFSTYSTKIIIKFTELTSKRKYKRKRLPDKAVGRHGHQRRS